MKKRSLKNLNLNKKVVSKFTHRELTGGKATSVSSVVCYLTTCTDLPTVNDSCFSVCNNICNDF